jgi:hypothetical protein
MTEPTMFSPWSLPKISDKVLRREKEQKEDKNL